jgi:hypothetical protein
MREFWKLRWFDAALAGLTADIDLQAQLERRANAGPMFTEPLCDAQPIHRVDPIEMLSHQSRLVGLYRADHVPLELRTKLGKRQDLFDPLLHIVLAEHALASGVGLPHCGITDGLADGDQCDALHGPPSVLAGLRNAPAYRIEVVCDHRHNSPEVSRRRNARRLTSVPPTRAKNGHHPAVGILCQEQGV